MFARVCDRNSGWDDEWGKLRTLGKVTRRNVWFSGVWPSSEQGSEKWGRWERIFLDKAKSHGQFDPKTTYEIYRHTERQIKWTLIFKL